MDKTYVKTIIEGLKSSSSNRVQDSLQKIRSKIVTTEDGIELFVDCGGLKCLVSHIRKPNEKILGLSLSILGNCCLNDKCRLEVSNLHAVPPLVSVLKTVCRDSIVGRACRVVGNLAQRQSSAEDLHNHGVVSALVTLIETRDKNTSYPTLTMAVRALRQLWTLSGKREEMLSLNSIRCISILLTTECESAGILKSADPQHEPSELRKSQEELISGILKSLVYFTTHATEQCAEQVFGDGRGYHCLVALINMFESLALRCLMNICFLSYCLPRLAIAGLVPSLVSILQKKSDVCCWPEGAARTLSQLSGESLNRSRIRLSGGLPLLIAAAKEHTFALKALLEYVFDDASFQILANAGLLNFLVDEMKHHLLTMKCQHDYKQLWKNVRNSDRVLNKTVDKKGIKENLAKEKTGLFKRRISCNEECLNVSLKRDDMFIGFRETAESDATDSPGEDETLSNLRKRLKRSSPVRCMEQLQGWGVGTFWEAKNERDGASTSRSLMTPEAPGSDGGFSPEYRWGKRRSDWSPESGFSTGEASSASPYWTQDQWSPISSSSPASPFSAANEDSLDSEISGRYSPVCEEAEATDETTTDVTSSVAVDAAQEALDELSVTDLDAEDNDDDYESFEDSEKETYIDTKSSRIEPVLALLYRLSHGSYDRELHDKGNTMPKDLIDQLSGKECLDALLDYIQKCRKPMSRPARILSIIFGNSLCLTNLLKNNIALKLHRMMLTHHPVTKCSQCRFIKKFCIKLMNRLNSAAESLYGIGEISYQLQRGPDCMKKTLSLTLPYIIKSKLILQKFFIQYDALAILFAEVPETTEEFEQYVRTLNKLSINVRIKDPKLLERRFSDYVCVSYDPILDGLSNEEIVTFELDDASTVRANRTFLCQNSEVFNAMLMGCFKESCEKTVKIKNATKDGLEYLFTLLHCGLNKSKCDICVIPMADKLETNLEVLLLADRFLFEKLKISCISAILQFKLTPDTVDKIYVWSLGEGMGFLCVESVAYLLTGKMSDIFRTQAFKNILNLEYRDQWLDDIQSIIKRQLEDVGPFD